MRFRWCAACDFIFAQDLDPEAYRAFYRSSLNDTGHVNDNDTSSNLFSMQAESIYKYLGAGFRGTCLDFGSGEGQLLQRLVERFPAATFYGTDLRKSVLSTDRIIFLDSLDTIPARFDFIILSHVAEHFVDLRDLSRLIKLLAPGGSMYFEVPDPATYVDFPRREFMYYFDRLHVNHFSRFALESWLTSYGLQVVQFGTHAFAYRDGKYPAQFAFATLHGKYSVKRMSRGTLRPAFEAYRASECRRAQSLREKIVLRAGANDLVVYGRGDNFFRSISPGGPLHQLPVKAILDRNAQPEFAMAGPKVMTPWEGLAAYPNAVVLITVSAGADEIVSEILATDPDRKVLLI